MLLKSCCSCPLLSTLRHPDPNSNEHEPQSARATHGDFQYPTTPYTVGPSGFRVLKSFCTIIKIKHTLQVGVIGHRPHESRSISKLENYKP